MSVPGKMHSFFVPGISLIGVGACHGIPHYVHTYHITKPLIVTDKGIVNTGILKIITDILDGDNIPYSIYDKTVPNPTDENVTEGVAQYKACLLYTSSEGTGEAFSKKRKPGNRIARLLSICNRRLLSSACPAFHSVIEPSQKGKPKTLNRDSIKSKVLGGRGVPLPSTVQSIACSFSQNGGRRSSACGSGPCACSRRRCKSEGCLLYTSRCV